MLCVYVCVCLLVEFVENISHLRMCSFTLGRLFRERAYHFYGTPALTANEVEAQRRAYTASRQRAKGKGRIEKQIQPTRMCVCVGGEREGAKKQKSGHGIW